MLLSYAPYFHCTPSHTHIDRGVFARFQPFVVFGNLLHRLFLLLIACAGHIVPHDSSSILHVHVIVMTIATLLPLLTQIFGKPMLPTTLTYGCCWRALGTFRSRLSVRICTRASFHASESWASPFKPPEESRWPVPQGFLHLATSISRLVETCSKGHHCLILYFVLHYSQRPTLRDCPCHRS